MIFDCFGLFVRTRLRWKDARAEMFTRNFILSPFRFLLCVPASASLTMMKTTRESGRKDGTRNFFNKISSRSSVAVYAWSTRGKKRNKLSSLIQIQSELIFRQEKYLLAISSEEKNFFHIETFYHTGARAKIIDGIFTMETKTLWYCLWVSTQWSFGSWLCMKYVSDGRDAQEIMENKFSNDLLRTQN